MPKCIKEDLEGVEKKGITSEPHDNSHSKILIS